MKLTATDRMVLLDIVPKTGNLLTLKIVKDLQNKLSLSAEELKRIGYKDAGDGRYQYSPGKALKLMKEIPIGHREREIITGEMRKRDKEEKLSMEMLPTVQKFATKEDAIA